MSGLIWLVLGLWALVGWSALGCYALQDYAYSRLEELCERGGVPDRFRAILKQQEYALLALELFLTVGTLALAVALSAWIGWPATPDWLEWGRFCAAYVTCGVVVSLAADLLPWTIARVASERFLYRWWPVIHVLLILLRPLLAVARQVDRLAHRLTGRGEPEHDDAAVIGEEIRTVVDEGRREGVLEQNAGAMIERVMELQSEDVGAIMTPRTDMCCIHVDASIEQARRDLVESGHSRVPVIGESTDDILGILYAKDLLRALAPDRQPGEPIPVLRDIVREPVYVPLTTEIPALLELMRREHVHIAIVLDEYGGVAGLVTMEDILEEIVGEIADEHDEEDGQPEIVAVSDTVAEVDARVHLDELNERFGYELPENEEFDTIGGFVFSTLGRVPAVGETVAWKRLTMTVLAADKRKITRLRIQVGEPSSTATGETR